jgi:DNA (cytosine-5)-methyltransferase 1
MIGNAVPSLLAEVLATAIRSQFLDGPLKNESYKLLQPRIKQIPALERETPVDTCYLHLCGNHPDHAGEGLGPVYTVEISGKSVGANWGGANTTIFILTSPHPNRGLSIVHELCNYKD